MSSSLCDSIDAFADLHVLVIGEAMLDSYLRGTSGRLCPEAPVLGASSTSCRSSRTVPPPASSSGFVTPSCGPPRLTA
jgi:hypothetical protein